MSADAVAAKDVGFFQQASRAYTKQTGQSASVWLSVAVANLVFQVFLYQEIADGHGREGEFGILTAAFGIIGLMTIPVVALHQALRSYPWPNGSPASFRSSTSTMMESMAWFWGACCFLIFFIPLPLPYLPRFPLQLLTLITVLIVLGSIISQTLYESENRLRFWSTLLVSSAVARVIIAMAIGMLEMKPKADTGLIIFLVAGLITVAPALRLHEVGFMERVQACRTFLDRDFLLFAGATFSVLMGIYLFTNADRIASLQWVDQWKSVGPVTLGVDGRRVGFDGYQAMGLLARSLLWGTQPLLWVLYAQRSQLPRTTAASLSFFWFYLGALVIGAFLLGCLAQAWHPIRNLFMFQNYGPTFAAVMVPLGLLQGLGVFSLASRRYPECFTLGACSLGYTLVLVLMDRHPESMLPYMFGASLVSIMIVLFVGVVRWGRKQP